MSTTRDSLQENLNGVQAELDGMREAIVRGADNADPERFETLMLAARSLDDQIDRIDRASARDQEAREAAEAAQTRTQRGRSFTDELIDNMEQARSGSGTVISRDVFTDADGSFGGLDIVPPDDQPAILERPRSSHRLLEVLPVLSTGSDTYKTYVQTGFTNAAANVARRTQAEPGGDYSAYPESDLTVVPKTFTVVKVGHYVRTDEDTLADRGQLDSLIRLELADGVEEQIEKQIFGAQVANGLDSVRTGAQTHSYELHDTDANQTALRLILALRKAKTMARRAKLPVDFAALSPVGIEAIETYQTNQGNFLAGGPWAGGVGTVWGLSLIDTDVLDAGDADTIGTAMVGSNRGYRLFSRRATEVRVSGNVNDDFVKDATVLKASARLIGANVRPESFVVVSPVDNVVEA